MAGLIPKRKYQCLLNLMLNIKTNYIGIHDDLIYRGLTLVIPLKLRKENISKVHYGHMGITKFQNRAKLSFFWPGMTKQIEDTVTNCPICLKHQNSQQKEFLKTHEIPAIPWFKIGTDIFQIKLSNYS